MLPILYKMTLCPFTWNVTIMMICGSFKKGNNTWPWWTISESVYSFCVTEETAKYASGSTLSNPLLFVFIGFFPGLVQTWCLSPPRLAWLNLKLLTVCYCTSKDRMSTKANVAGSSCANSFVPPLLLCYDDRKHPAIQDAGFTRNPDSRALQLK